MNDLDKIREKISQCDDQLIEMLAQRMEYVKDIIAYKKEHRISILQPEQEDKQYRALRAKLEDHPYEEEIENIFRYVVKNSRRIQAKGLFSYNIMLIGFMGTGKSTVSSYLSEMLAMEEIEMDELIEQKEGMKITEIFEKYGEPYFRDCETDILEDLQRVNQAIVSCGGGAVLRDENVELMKKRGRIVLLTADPETVYERVKDSDERPILNQNMSVEYIASLMENRREKYQNAADIVVATDNKGIRDICEEMIEKIAEMES